MPKSPWQIVELPSLTALPCPCGQARRALAEFDAFPGTVHLTDISNAAVAHHHNEHTEIYVILECDADAAIELDGIRHPVQPLTLIAIPPGVVHRAIGKIRTLIVCHPEFDSADEVLAPTMPQSLSDRTETPKRT